MKNNLKKYFIFVFLGLFSFFLRIINLSKYDFSYDEISGMVRHNFIDTLLLPIDWLYGNFLNYWMIFGSSEFTLRLSSVLFGVFSVFGIYLLAKELFDEQTGFLSAFLLSLSPFSIHYSQEIRPYSLVIFLSVLSTYFFIKAIKHSSNYYLVLNIILNTLSIYFKYTAIFLPVAQFLVFLIFFKKQISKKILWVYIIQLVLLVPWICILFSHFILTLHFAGLAKQISPFIDSVTFINLFYSLENFISGYYAASNIRIIGLILVAVLSYRGISYLFRKERVKLFLLLSFIFIPMFLLFIISQFKVFYAERYMVSSFIFLYIILAFSLTLVSRKIKFLGIIFIILFSMVSLFYYYSNRMETPEYERKGTFEHKEFKKAADYLRANYKKGDLVFYTGYSSTLPIEYYMHQYEQKYFVNKGAHKTGLFVRKSFLESIGREWLIVHQIESHDFYLYMDIKNFMIQDTDALVKKNNRIWLVLSSWGHSYNLGCVDEWFNKRLSLFNRKKLGGIEIILYIKPMV